MSTIQIIELYFYCDDGDDGPSMWIWWTLSKEHMLNLQPLSVWTDVGLKGGIKT